MNPKTNAQKYYVKYGTVRVAAEPNPMAGGLRTYRKASKSKLRSDASVLKICFRTCCKERVLFLLFCFGRGSGGDGLGPKQIYFYHFIENSSLLPKQI